MHINLKIGGYVLSDDLRNEAMASDEAEVQDLADLKGELPNSSARTWEIAGGAAYIGEGGSLGLSVSRYDSLYGVPVRYDTHHDDQAAEEGHESHAHEVKLDVVQTRVDLRGEVKLKSGFIDAVRLRAGYADYQHNELEEGGVIGTSFYHSGWEGRLDLIQQEMAGWTGAIGAQALVRKLNIIGEEKYLPKIKAEYLGLYSTMLVSNFVV
jgi:iron complex outermembrane receptor protein